MEKLKTDIRPHVRTKNPVISVIGGPGSGKGTLCELLAKHYGLYHVSIGNLLREEAKSQSKISKEIAEAIKEGKNVNVDIVLVLLKKTMLDNPSYKGFLLDGFPRDVHHGSKFEEKIAPISCILYLQASESTLKKRLLKRAKDSDRIDDNLISIEKRLQIYLELEGDILKKYSSKIRKVSSEKPVMEVFHNTITVLNDIFIPKKET